MSFVINESSSWLSLLFCNHMHYSSCAVAFTTIGHHSSYTCIFQTSLTWITITRKHGLWVIHRRYATSIMTRFTCRWCSITQYSLIRFHIAVFTMITFFMFMSYKDSYSCICCRHYYYLATVVNMGLKYSLSCFAI